MLGCKTESQVDWQSTTIAIEFSFFLFPDDDCCFLKTLNLPPSTPVVNDIINLFSIHVHQRRRFYGAHPAKNSSTVNSLCRFKMLEYREYGVRLGWLIVGEASLQENPQERTVEVYRIDKAAEILESPNSVSGEDVLPEFVLNLAKVW